MERNSKKQDVKHIFNSLGIASSGGCKSWWHSCPAKQLWTFIQDCSLRS